MAVKVKAFPERTRSSKYPWDEWLDGDIWELVAGEDFMGKPATFRSAANTKARSKGGKVRTRMVTQGDQIRLYVQYFSA